MDINALFQGAVGAGQIDKQLALTEINQLIKWQEDRKRWHLNKTRQKMAAEGTSAETIPGVATFKGSDFGLDEVRVLHPSHKNLDCKANPRITG